MKIYNTLTRKKKLSADRQFYSEDIYMRSDCILICANREPSRLSFYGFPAEGTEVQRI